MVGYADYQACGEPAELWSKLVKALKKHKGEEEGALRVPVPRPWEAGGNTSEDWNELVSEIAGASKVLVVTGGNLSSQSLDKLPAEIEKLGWSSEPHGLIHLRDGVNSVGHDAVGLISEWSDEDAESYQAHWGTFNSKPSKSYGELCRGETGVLIAAGCDPMAEEGAKKPRFLVAMASHPSKTTEKADLILPLSTWLESHGVFVSTDGRVQFQRQAILPQGESKPAWEIAALLTDCLEEEQGAVNSPRQVYAELARVNANFAGCSYDDFKAPGVVHWSYPQQADLGMPRPDLSAIPVSNPDAPAWMPAEATGSKVEEASRLLRGDVYPAVPGQRDPREVAALLGLKHPMAQSSAPALGEGEEVAKREGYVPLRVVSSSSAQPAGPSPASRHHEIGVGRRRQVAVPVHQTAVLEAESEPEAENSEEAKS